MLIRIVDRFVEALAVCALVVSTGMICINVINRYLVHVWLRAGSEQYEWLTPVYQAFDEWLGAVSVTADEVPGYLLVWLAFLGAYLALRGQGHISFDMVVNRMPRGVGQGVRILTDLMVLAFFVMLFVTSVRMIRVDGATEIETAEIGQGWFMAIMPLSAVLIGGVYGAQLISRVRLALGRSG